MKFIEYPDADMMMIDLANQLVGELGECLMVHEHASFAVPGGSTPGPVFDALCAARLDWPRVHVLLNDERQVPADHERSNERLIRERLLQSHAAEATYVSIRPEGDALPDISAELPISVLLLGMGADMHTASLFPGSQDLDAALAPEAPDLMAVAASDGLEPRITMSARVLAGAMSTHVLITGAEKRAAIERAMELDPHEAPIKTVLGTATVHWAP
ncbi:6-phosphogluconolactonase [Litoreibacter ponti]|uniref:6-phosphogluconolactonase n=1 Tax=Litoreibacter ponti TaxID=1510457 RepID=A0A2T6BJ32_9RHOB|nr:6-phosphogluconolactonase [Litoreibacter ponti]PTX56067.1 6-phosphogluconolactonase [Litoreibacter ponti]